MINYELIANGIFLPDYETIFVLNDKFYKTNDPIDEITYIEVS